MDRLPRTNRSLIARILPTSMFWRLALTYIAFILLLMGALSGYLALEARNNYIERLADRMAEEASMVSGSVASEALVNDIDRVDAEVESLGQELNVRVTVIAADGRVLGDSRANPRQMENHASRPEVREAVMSGYGKAQRTSTTLQQEFMYVAVPVAGSGGAVLRLATPLEEVSSVIKILQRDVLVATVVATVLACGAAILVSDRIFRPLSEFR